MRYTDSVAETIGGGDEVVVKSQILAGGRGLGTFANGFQGGVHVVKRADRAHEVLITKPRDLATASTAGAVNIQPPSARHQTCVRRALPTPSRLKGATVKPTVSVMQVTRGAMGARARRAWRESTKRQRDLAVAATAGVVNTHPPWALRATGLV